MGSDNGDAKLDAAMDGLFRRSRLDSSPALGGAPAPGGDGSGVGWDDRADAILRAAHEAPAASSRGGAIDALLAAPDLEHEPGEPQLGAGNAAASRNGTQQMSDEMSSKPPPSRRPSLKELAESMKNRPSTPAPGPVSVSGVPGSDAGPASAQPGSQRHSLKNTLVALDGQLPAPPSARNDSAPMSRPSTPAPLGTRGSSSATPPSGVAPVSASSGPASASPASSGPASVPIVALAPAPPVSNPVAIPSTKPSPGVGKPKEGGGGATIGIGIAVIGLAAAAAFGLWMKSKPQPIAGPTVAAVETAAPVAAAKEAPKDAAKPEEEKKPDGVLDLSQLDDASSAAPSPGKLGGPLPGGSAAASAPVAVASGGPPKPGGPGEELGDAIKKRAGGGAGVGDDAEPAAAEGSKKNLPDVPPTGAVTSAVNAVKGGAKGCVAGADEPSTATITFSSSGAVQSVSVGGWASGKPAAGCIKSALQSAKVPAFARPSYATSVTIRP